MIGTKCDWCGKACISKKGVAVHKRYCKESPKPIPAPTFLNCIFKTTPGGGLAIEGPLPISVGAVLRHCPNCGFELEKLRKALDNMAAMELVRDKGDGE